jgi:hypothetical protein
MTLLPRGVKVHLAFGYMLASSGWPLLTTKSGALRGRGGFLGRRWPG